ncbi:MAG TPA: glycosyltransferase family 2 protein [bacterium]|nr:glycosyltransferase family 2 protein [bacterium]
MNFSIIIVSWNTKEKLRENLLALSYSSQVVSREIIVIDNASEDGTVAMVQTEFPEVILIRNQENIGFAKASNQGLRVATGDFLILLNPDMKILTDTLVNLKKWLDDNPQADVTGITLIDEHNSLLPQVRKFPSVWTQLAIVLKLPHLFPQILHNYLQVDFDYNQSAIVDSIRGAFFVISRSALSKYGYLDERYFLWFEEVDYCKTVKEKGGEVWYTPVARAIDYVGQSFSQLPRVTKQKYFRNSMVSYFKKWYPYWQGEIISLGWEIAEAIVSIGDICNIKPRTKT